MTDKYILNENHDPVLCSDLMEWGRWLETADRHVAQDEIGDVRVSTVFLGLDHNFGGGSPSVRDDDLRRPARPIPSALRFLERSGEATCERRCHGSRGPQLTRNLADSADGSTCR